MNLRGGVLNTKQVEKTKLAFKNYSKAKLEKNSKIFTIGCFKQHKNSNGSYFIPKQYSQPQ